LYQTGVSRVKSVAFHLVRNESKKGGVKQLEDGLILMYIKDGKIYPIAMSQEQYDLLQVLGKAFEPIKVIDKPQGEAVNLVGTKELFL